jgi:hypothetical protein
MKDTKSIVESKDVVWLNKPFDKFFNKEGVKNLSPIEEEDAYNDFVMTKLVSGISLEETSKDDEESKGETEKNASFDMPHPISKKRRIDSGDEAEFGCIGAVVSDPKEPKSFDQAWNCDTNERND